MLTHCARFDDIPFLITYASIRRFRIYLDLSISQSLKGYNFTMLTLSADDISLYHICKQRFTNIATCEIQDLSLEKKLNRNSDFQIPISLQQHNVIDRYFKL